GAALALAAAAVSGVLLMARREDPSVRIGAEPSIHTRRDAPVAPPLASTNAVVPETPTKETPPPRSSHPPPATLVDELKSLQRAESALATSDTAGALAELDRYDRVLHGKQMVNEAALLRMEALSRAGNRAAASALAVRFVASNPRSPLVDRAR